MDMDISGYPVDGDILKYTGIPLLFCFSGMGGSMSYRYLYGYGYGYGTVSGCRYGPLGFLDM